MANTESPDFKSPEVGISGDIHVGLHRFLPTLKHLSNFPKKQFRVNKTFAKF